MHHEVADSTAAAGLARGGCLCGAVSFAAELPSKWVAHCHCSRCQRAHGAAFVTWAGFPETAVGINDPEHCLHWHVASAGGHRGFCGRCGSPMFFKSERWAGELHIARALFTDALDREPMAHVFYETHVSWVALGDALPRKHSESSQ
jgi:hypothetical protein